MRGSLFVASPWGRQPMRPVTVIRLAQTCPVNAAPGECPLEEPSQPTVPTGPGATSEPESSFPVVPVVAGAGVLVLAALLLG
jgi:hypothetical protein